MKKLFLFALCSALLTPLSAAPFEGAFVGLSGGGTHLEGTTSFDNIKPVIGIRGGILGLHAGMDGVFYENFLLGIGANIDFSEEALIARSVTGELKAGYIMGNVAVGVQAGWGTAKIKNAAYINNENSHIHVGGPTIGPFISTMITPHVELTGRYNHTFLGEKEGVALGQDTLRVQVSYKF